LPGASVTLELAGHRREQSETVTDAAARINFFGSCLVLFVKATMQGFRAVEQRNLVVNADVTARADLSLPIGEPEGRRRVRRGAVAGTTSACGRPSSARTFCRRCRIESTVVDRA
jgi:hypothetical protein